MVVGTVSQPSSEMMVRLLADRSRLDARGLAAGFFVLPRPVCVYIHETRRRACGRVDESAAGGAVS